MRQRLVETLACKYRDQATANIIYSLSMTSEGVIHETRVGM